MFTLLGHGTQVLGDLPALVDEATPQNYVAGVAMKYGQPL